MSDRPDEAAQFPQRLAEDFVKQLNITLKAHRLYPPTSELPRVSAERVVAALRRLLECDPTVVLEVSREGLSLGGVALFPKSQSFAAFAREFYARRVTGLRFHSGVDADDIAALMGALCLTPEDLFAQGGLGSALWDRGVSDIAVTEVAVLLIDGELPAESSDGEPDDSIESDRRSLEEIIRSAGSGHARDRRILVRLLRDRRVVADYVARSIEGARGSAISDASAGVTALAHALEGELPVEQEMAMQGLARAIAGLDLGLRDRLYRSRLLENARRDQTMAALVGDLGVDEVLDVLLSSVGESDAARSGTERAIRNLAALHAGTSAEPVVAMAAAKMRSLGFDDETVSEMARAASPDRIATPGAPQRAAGARPVASVLRLIDMARDTSGVFVHDDSVQPLRDEAATGTTDGDVISALVTAAIVEDRDIEFGRVMALVQTGLTVLVESQDYEAATAAVQALNRACELPGLSESRRLRMREAVGHLANPRSMGEVTATMRSHRSDSTERACRTLLELLGPQAIDSLLEVLAEEPDMAARKKIIELVTPMAASSLPQLAARLSDPRWFLVRNVVSILSATRSPEVLPHLTRTLRHSDARVRRETIRGLVGFRSGMAVSMLAGALADDDPRNVQLAARLLGTSRATAAVTALEEAARGEGRGNRETAVRVEAIGALAAIGARGSIPTLRLLARRRGMFAGRKGREVRAAAEAALRSMERADGGQR